MLPVAKQYRNELRYGSVATCNVSKKKQNRTQMPAYQRKVVDDELDELLEGAKGVGQTATAGPVHQTGIRLDEPAQRAIAETDMELVLAHVHLFLNRWDSFYLM
ncbi:MAG: hypothetical protein WCI81_09565 [Chlorobiaceae bacterium]